MMRAFLLARFTFHLSRSTRPVPRKSRAQRARSSLPLQSPLRSRRSSPSTGGASRASGSAAPARLVSARNAAKTGRTSSGSAAMGAIVISPCSAIPGSAAMVSTAPGNSSGRKPYLLASPETLTSSRMGSFFCGHEPAQPLRQLDAIHRVHHAGPRQHVLGLAALQVADQVPGRRRRRGDQLSDRLHLGRGLLHPVLAEDAQPGRTRRRDLLRRMHLAHRHQRHLSGITPGAPRGRGNPLLDRRDPDCNS